MLLFENLLMKPMEAELKSQKVITRKQNHQQISGAQKRFS